MCGTHVLSVFPLCPITAVQLNPFHEAQHIMCVFFWLQHYSLLIAALCCSSAFRHSLIASLSLCFSLIILHFLHSLLAKHNTLCVVFWFSLLTKTSYYLNSHIMLLCSIFSFSMFPFSSHCFSQAILMMRNQKKDCEDRRTVLSGTLEKLEAEQRRLDKVCTAVFVGLISTVWTLGVCGFSMCCFVVTFVHIIEFQ